MALLPGHTVVLETDNQFQAGLIESRLRAAGIEPVVLGGNHLSWYPLPVTIFGGRAIRVLVPDEDVEDARALMVGEGED